MDDQKEGQRKNKMVETTSVLSATKHTCPIQRSTLTTNLNIKMKKEESHFSFQTAEDEEDHVKM